MPSPPGLGTRFWTLWSASTLSNFADGVYRVVLPLLAVQYTRSPLLVSLVAALAYLPLLLFALPAGALADRRDRRRILVGMEPQGVLPGTRTAPPTTCGADVPCDGRQCPST